MIAFLFKLSSFASNSFTFTNQHNEAQNIQSCYSSLILNNNIRVGFQNNKENGQSF